ncbi:MAG: pirin family protein [Candidatus Eisenbacteria bacterium]
MKIREIATTIEPQETRDGAGVRLRRTIASRALDYLDPFLLLDHFGSEIASDYEAGFPMHPHRGIETVTYMLEGSVRHKDSTGREGVIGAGDVQWMSAGRAILHEEMPETGPKGNFGFQLWVNLPQSLKMSRPRYQEFRASEIPEVTHDGSRVKIVAGEVGGVKGAVTDIAAQPTYLDVHMPEGRRFTQGVPRGHAAFAYLYEGDASFGEEDVRVRGPRLVVFQDGDAVTATPLGGPARFLLVSGAPIGEPIARWGPFVMNTREEIEGTLAELRDGRFADMAAER